MIAILWLIGFGLLLVWLALLAARVRQSRDSVIPRVHVIGAAALVAALGFSSAYVWGVDVGQRGMDKILASASQSAEQVTAEPPRARLFLRHVQVLLAPEGDDATHQALVGYSPEATLRMPRGYGLDEAKQGWDILRVSAAGPQGLGVETIEHPEPTTTRVIIHAERRAIAAAPSPDGTARAARAFVGRGPDRCRADPTTQAGVLDGPGAIYAILCIGRSPRAALVFERDLASVEGTAPDTAVRVTPLVWRGNRWRHHHVRIASGSLIQIGTMDDALPGVALWEVPAPDGRAELFFPPKNLHADCVEWLSGRDNEGFFSNPQRSAATGPPAVNPRDIRANVTSEAGDSICVLPFTPPFGLEVRRLLPDLPGISARSLWAAGLMTTPALLMLLLLCASARSQLTAQRFQRLLTMGWLAALFAAIGVWRLLWAHRIDMLRDYESVGARVLQNQLLLVLGGAALAATCVLSWNPGRRAQRALGIGVFAWLVWLVVSGYALRGDFSGISFGGRLIGQIAVSLAIGTAVGWIEPLRTRAGPALTRRLADISARLAGPWLAAMAGLVAIAVVAGIASVWFPRAVVLKLTLAWLFVLAVYAALRTSIHHAAGSSDDASGAGLALGRSLAAFALGGVCMLMLFRLDPGVTVAIAGPGLIASLLFASHDARFADASLRQIDSFRRHHAPLVLAHAAMFIALGGVVAVWSLSGLLATTAGEPDAMLSRSLTLGGIDLLAVVAALFLPAAALAYVRRGARAAAPWLVAVVLFSALWAVRGMALDRVIGSSTQAANRIAIVLDPGYALLRSESKFLSGITAWRETIVPAAPDGSHSATDIIDGQGYFGAQLIDPGVLLSIENDYFPVLLLREAGARGVVLTTLLLLILVAGLWILSGSRFRHGSAAQRARSLAAIVLGVVCIYQPLASLGVLPLTGIAWPGLGLDSPSDFWLLTALVLWVLVWRSQASGRASRGDSADAKLEQFDGELRSSRLFRRSRTLVSVTAGVVVLASLLLLVRASAFALRRPNPVDPQGRTVKPFDGLEHAIDYAYHLQCPWPDKTVPVSEPRSEILVPDDLLGDPEHASIARFHASLRAAWQAHRHRGVAELARFLAGEPACSGASGPWSFARSPDDPDECRMTFKSGWPRIQLTVTRGPARPDEQDQPTGDGDKPGDADDPAGGDKPGDASSGPEPVHAARCQVDVGTDVIRQLRFPARRPYRDARIRLVSRAMGDAARDRGELVSGHLAVRLRPGAGAADMSRAQDGLYAAEQVKISDDLSIVLQDGQAVLRRTTAPQPTKPGKPADQDTWLFVRDPPPHSRVQVLEANEGTWSLLPSDVTDVPLTRLALLVVGGPDARSLWLYRPPVAWLDEPSAVPPLIADEVGTVLGERRRHYLFGGLVPEIGWVNPYHARMSLGLDGWIRVALAEYETARPQQQRWLDSGEEVPYCGTLAPSQSAPDQPPAPRSSKQDASEIDPALARVCRRSTLDGVLECRVSVQPELSIRLRHLTELVSLEPTRFGDPKKSAAPVRAGFALLRGDTGEIVAQGEFVPGRASSAYAPATPEIENHLIRLREDREPKTGRKLPASARGEASAEKIEWSQPIAMGSTMKPLLAHAVELADPEFARSLVLDGAPVAGARCRDRKVHAIFGHCPPTESLWKPSGRYDLNRFLAESVNWYQAALGMLGTAVPRGSWGFGGPNGDDDGVEVDLPTLAAKNAGDYPTTSALFTAHRGRRVISSRGTIYLENLRKTTMWQRFEQILGRPLCLAGSKRRCRRDGTRRDLCAARALPVRKPTRDLRHLVALGPSSFDFYPRLADPTKRVGPVVRTREYLQFLRGSGLHPLGSLIQLTDSFNRVVYEYARDPDRDGGYALAASWFPVATAGSLPDWDCSQPAAGNDVKSGVCNVLRRGTAARVLGSLLDDPRFAIYGAKTGTIDSLADIAENREACEHFRTGHTVADRPEDAKQQPYWLACGKRRTPVQINDSLLVISFAVRSGDTNIPLTLGLRFQRSGPGFSALVARHYMDVIYDYFAAPGGANSGGANSQ